MVLPQQTVIQLVCTTAFRSFSLIHEFVLIVPGGPTPRLCPFCDTELPQILSPTLNILLNDALTKCGPEPRITNQYGRATNVIDDYIQVCFRHQLELEELPKAEKFCWPTSIDFDLLVERILSHNFLQALQTVAGSPQRSEYWRIVVGDASHGLARETKRLLKGSHWAVPG